MKAEEILKSRWLDILFEHRNKEYGAYAIRKTYNMRLAKAVIAAIVLSVVIFLLLQNIRAKNHALLFNITDQDITPAYYDQPQKQPEIKQSEPPRKSIAYVVPVFTKDPVQPQVTSPDDHPDADITGTNNTEAPPATTITQPAAPPATPAPPLKQPDPEPAPVVNDAPVTAPDEQSEYPGGQAKMQEFLQRELQDYVIGEGIPKKVKLFFIVDKDGTITSIEVLSGEDSDFNKKAVRAVQKMPRWKPAVQRGYIVKAYRSLIINMLPPEEYVG